MGAKGTGSGILDPGKGSSFFHVPLGILPAGCGTDIMDAFPSAEGITGTPAGLS
jgi:hypothetical protein